MSTISVETMTPDERLGYLSALDRAIYQGVDSVKYGELYQSFRSLKDMIAIRDMIRAELGAPGAPTGRRIHTRRMIVRRDRG